jgi:glycosyltransferase involved in cell wall biosynthesis
VEVGGGFQQSLSTIAALRALRGHEVLVLTQRKENVAILRARGVNCELYRFGRLRRVLTRMAARSRRLRRIYAALPKVLWRTCGPFDAVVDAHRVDLVICFFLSPLPDYLFHRPFVTTVYDLCHREHCEFPEVSERFEFENRERIFREVLPRAVAVLVSSSFLAQRLLRYYGIDESRTVTLPFLPAAHARAPVASEEVARVRKRYSLPERYVFYPAQLWAHKNHVYILEAVRILAESMPSAAVDAVFCGSDFGNGGHVHRTAQRLGIASRVRTLGFVDSDDMAPLYAGASALVMPTYFGPTNLPPLEAMAVGCPVIYSDLPEFRADLGDAALYCDLSDPASLARQICAVVCDPNLRAALRSASAELLQRAGHDTYAQTMQGVFDRFAYLRGRWATP